MRAHCARYADHFGKAEGKHEREQNIFGVLPNTRVKKKGDFNGNNHQRGQANNPAMVILEVQKVFVEVSRHTHDYSNQNLH